MAGMFGRASGDQHLLAKVTRIEVIDADGRAFVGHYDDAGVTIDSQDDGRTIKVFAGRRSSGALPGGES